MELNFQLIDCDYVLIDGKPIIRLFGKTEDNKTACTFYRKFQPYFYVLLKENESTETLIKFLEKNFKKDFMKAEEVKKFLPIGYQKEKPTLIKITLKDPSQTPFVRDELKKQNFIKEIFEADILFKYRFMNDFNISGMRWVKASGRGIDTSTVKTEKIFEAEFIAPLESEKTTQLKFLSVDIEVIPSVEGIPDPKKDSIAIISFSFYPAYEGHNTLVLAAKPFKKKNKDTEFFSSEKEMLQEFVKIIDIFDPDVILGYNINNFDFPYILERLTQQKISKSIGRCNQKQAFSRKFAMKSRSTVSGRIVVDVYDLIKESVGKGQFRLKRYGLGDVSKELLNEDKLDIAHSEIGLYWNGNEDQFDKLIEYARKDAELTLKLLLEIKLLEKFIEISRVSGVLLQDILDSGESVRVENLLLKEFNKLDFVIPNRPDSQETARRTVEREKKGLVGALVLDPLAGLHTKNVIYLDFKSMYPSIFISYNICPTTLLGKNVTEPEVTNTPYGAKFVSPKIREGIFSRVIKEIIKERDKVKIEMKKAKNENERSSLDARQYALKVMTNAFYGYTGYIRARFYVLDIANAITSCGRELILKTKEIVERDSKFKVIYGDTDSIMVKTESSDLEETFELGANIESIVNKELAGKLEIKIESVFKTILILAKKRYAGLSCEKEDGEWKEKIIMKGIETIRRDWCDLTSKTLFGVLDILLKEQDTKKAFNYVKDILSKIEKNQIPIEDLVVTKSISKSLKEYKGTQPHIELVKKMRQRSPAGAPGVGDRVGFVIVKGLQLMSDRAEDPIYIKQHGLKIDSRYYIESQVLPPLERVFEALGIGKSELVGAGKQLLLADIIKNNVKKPKDESLTQADGFICTKCSKTYRRIPLIGKCTNCSGEIMFYSGESKSRSLTL
jgi:DNA polymerase I